MKVDYSQKLSAQEWRSLFFQAVTFPISLTLASLGFWCLGLLVQHVDPAQVPWAAWPFLVGIVLSVIGITAVAYSGGKAFVAVFRRASIAKRAARALA